MEQYNNLYEYLMANEKLLDIIKKRVYSHIQTPRDCKEDLMQDIYLTLLEYPISKLKHKTEAYVNNLIFKITSNYVYSKTSKAYRQYTRPSMQLKYDASKDSRINNLNMDDALMYSIIKKEIIDVELTAYQKKLLQEYFTNDLSYREISSKYDISLIALWTDVNETIEIIKNKLGLNDEE